MLNFFKKNKLLNFKYKNNFFVPVSIKNFATQKRSQQKDYYAILGIDKNATEEDIKKAYRNLGKLSVIEIS